VKLLDGDFLGHRILRRAEAGDSGEPARCLAIEPESIALTLAGVRALA